MLLDFKPNKYTIQLCNTRLKIQILKTKIASAADRACKRFYHTIGRDPNLFSCFEDTFKTINLIYLDLINVLLW